MFLQALVLLFINQLNHHDYRTEHDNQIYWGAVGLCLGPLVIGFWTSWAGKGASIRFYILIWFIKCFRLFRNTVVDFNPRTDGVCHQHYGGTNEEERHYIQCTHTE